MTLTASEIEDLKLKLEYYEAIFSTDDTLFDIKKKLKTTTQVAAVIKLFLLSRMNVILNDLILLAAEPYGRHRDHDNSYAKIVVWRVRQVFKKIGVEITNEYDAGYTISNENREKLKEALK